MQKGLNPSGKWRCIYPQNNHPELHVVCRSPGHTWRVCCNITIIWYGNSIGRQPDSTDSYITCEYIVVNTYRCTLDVITCHEVRKNKKANPVLGLSLSLSLSYFYFFYIRTQLRTPTTTTITVITVDTVSWKTYDRSEGATTTRPRLAVKTKTSFGFPTRFNVTQPFLVWGPVLGLLKSAIIPADPEHATFKWDLVGVGT